MNSLFRDQDSSDSARNASEQIIEAYTSLGRDSDLAKRRAHERSIAPGWHADQDPIFVLVSPRLHSQSLAPSACRGKPAPLSIHHENPTMVRRAGARPR